MNSTIRKHKSKEIGRPISDLSGETFGRWLVIRLDSRDKWGRSFWECRCKCGKSRAVRRDALTRNISKSCGCLAREKSSIRELKHGYCIEGRTNGNATYVSWKGMKQRCNDPNADQYPHYGAVGIKVCNRWTDSFENFVSDMGERPQGMTLDRINPYGDYEPNNCRWADYFVQNNNQKRHYHKKQLE